MTDIRPSHQLNSTVAVDDLKELLTHPGPFATIHVQLPSSEIDAGDRAAIRWKNALQALGDDYPAERRAELEQLADGFDHAAAAAVVVVQAADGHVLVEPLTIGLDADRVDVDDVPRLVAVLEHRQRTLPHVVVDTDRVGATVAAFDGGSVAEAEVVEGETLHVHRGQPGGWSQRRFQQRAENTWEDNAANVAETARSLGDQVGAVLYAVAGEERAANLTVDALGEVPGASVVMIEAGTPDGIADETLTAVADLHARLRIEILDRLRGSDTAVTEPDEVTAALERHQVEVLLVNDNGGGDRRIDTAVASALATGADVIVMPGTPELDGGLAAINRW